MTQSYNIGGITPIQIDPYEATEYDPVENINKKIDDDIRDWERYWVDRANYYKTALAPERSASARLKNFAQGLEKDLPVVVDWARNYKEYGNARKHHIAAANGAQYTDQNGNLVGEDVDETIAKDILAEGVLFNEQRTANGILAKHGANLDLETKEKLLSVGRKEQGELSNLAMMSRRIPLGFNTLATQWAITVPAEISSTGEARQIPLKEAANEKEYDFISYFILGALVNEAKNLSNNQGRRSRFFHRTLHEYHQAHKHEWYNTISKAQIDDSMKTRRTEFLNRVNEDPGYFVKYVGINGSNGGNAIAKRHATDMLIKGIEDRDVDRSTVENIRGYEFESYDGSGKKKVGDYWTAQTAEIDKALRTAEREDLNALIVEKELLDEQTFQEAKARFLENPTEANLRAQDLWYKKQRKTNESHEGFKTLMTDSDVLDLTVEEHILNKHENGHIITEGEISLVKDEKIKERLQKLVGTGLNTTKQGEMHKFLYTRINRHTGENTGKKEKTTRWEANYLGAKRAYIRAYNDAKALGLSDDKAHRAGVDAVNLGLKDNNWDSYEKIYGNIDPEVYDHRFKLARKVSDAILKDRTLLDKNELLESEDRALLDAARYFSGHPDVKNIPEYYRLLAAKLGMNPVVLARKRLEATGQIKPGSLEYQLPEEKNLNKADQQKLLYMPSDSRTYQVTQDNQELTWMLETIASPTAIANGGYNSIRNPDGEYVQLEKPLEEHTIAEVIRLVDLGYTNFGMYDVSPTALSEVINSAYGFIDYDQKFDVDTQDKIILQRLRLKANAKNDKRGLDVRYRRLVHVNESDKARFLEIVGDLPPWLQLENLIPEAAKALVDDTLPEE